MNKLKKTCKRLRVSGVVLIALTAALILQTAMMCYFGEQKAGYHIDEMFTFELANFPDTFVSRSEGFLEAWKPGDFFRDVLTVEGGERFNYAIPYHNQKEDVHPPLYYFVIHTISSLFPGVFTKWIGIAPNMLFCLLTTIALYCVSLKITKNRLISILVAGVWALSVGAMTSAVFIRMYAMLTFLCTMLVLLHLKALEHILNGQGKAKTFFALWLCTTAGILTQYYFLIFCFFLCGAFFLFILFWRDWKQLIWYVLAELGAVFASALLFPQMVFHIFGSYRGKEALSSLNHSGDYVEKLKKVTSVISQNILGGWIKEVLVLLGALVLLYALNQVFFHIVLHADRITKTLKLKFFFHLNKEITLSLSLQAIIVATLSVVVVGYTVVVAKVAPYQTDRYYMCIYPLIVFLLIQLLYWGGALFISNKRILEIALVGMMALFSLVCYQKQSINYLYKSNQLRDCLTEYTDFPVIVINRTTYEEPDVWLSEFQNYKVVFRCKKNGDLSGLEKAVDTYDLSGGFLLYAQGFNHVADDKLFSEIGAYIDVAEFDKLTSVGCPVYFCALEASQ